MVNSQSTKILVLINTSPQPAFYGLMSQEGALDALMRTLISWLLELMWLAAMVLDKIFFNASRKLIYFNHIRPIISFPVRVISQHDWSTKAHLEVAMEIVMWNWPLEKEVAFNKDMRRSIETYCDASWGVSIIERTT